MSAQRNCATVAGEELVRSWADDKCVSVSWLCSSEFFCRTVNLTTELREISQCLEMALRISANQTICRWWTCGQASQFHVYLPCLNFHIAYLMILHFESFSSCFQKGKGRGLLLLQALWYFAKTPWRLQYTVHGSAVSVRAIIVRRALVTASGRSSLLSGVQTQ